jgi:hypothetical protein
MLLKQAPLPVRQGEDATENSKQVGEKSLCSMEDDLFGAVCCWDASFIGGRSSVG